MKKLFFLLVLIPFISIAQFDSTQANRILPRTPEGFWTMIGAITGILTAFSTFLLFLYKKWEKAISKKFDPILQENQKLRQDLEERYRYPQFAKDAISLTEIGAERQIQKLRDEHQKALEEDKQQRAIEISAKISELKNLQDRFIQISTERDKLQQQLRNSIIREEVKHDNAVLLYTGLILLIKYKGSCGAIKAIDQAWKDRDSFIKYYWWYQTEPNINNFISPSTQSGYAETGEWVQNGNEKRYNKPILNIGPIKLQWSAGGNGAGWVYYGLGIPSDDYQLALTNEIDITKINITNYKFERAPALNK
ncbi:MAG: hypothetical protein ICV51_16195 [Flavisolibacter sp.]|nr:hypothetical protein [Flavisolibacter sp.]